ncbi:MAG: NrfD/PsrC family molybdoenzyme membrane anchor subunit [Bacteroidia bacterium]
MQHESSIREPLILGDKTFHQISEDIARPVEGKANKYWYIVFWIASLAWTWGFCCIAYTIGTGIGAWGLNKTIGWAWDITNFVWWIGIGHAGTLISAVLLLFRQKWRMSINRSAEAMTIFAVLCAAIFPVIHMGRPWLAYFVLPLPNQFGSLWVNFNSPLLWDVFAISTYFSVSVVFWYIGLIPDFAMIRDRANTPLRRKIYSILSFGWSGRAKDWNRYEEVSLVLAGIATPLVFSVHSIVSMDFATSLVRGWHSTIYPPYFVAGAVFSGFAMVLTLLIIVRKVFSLEEYITLQHIEMMNKVMLLTGSIVAIAYFTEFFMAWYSGDPNESFIYLSVDVARGPYWWAFTSLILCNTVLPQIMWFKKARRNLYITFIISIIVNIGMWFERFMIIVTDLYRDYLPSSWTIFHPTFIEVGIFVGTIGMFFTLFLLFARVFPVINQTELKTVLKSSGSLSRKENHK